MVSEEDGERLRERKIKMNGCVSVCVCVRERERERERERIVSIGSSFFSTLSNRIESKSLERL